MPVCFAVSLCNHTVNSRRELFYFIPWSYQASNCFLAVQMNFDIFIWSFSEEITFNDVWKSQLFRTLHFPHSPLLLSINSRSSPLHLSSVFFHNFPLLLTAACIAASNKVIFSLFTFLPFAADATHTCFNFRILCYNIRCFSLCIFVWKLRISLKTAIYLLISFILI